ncbi:MAG: hypothetical protein H0X31_00300 [Nostocaceae cyanobacterium]|nr:hypothetical protein [Nostocaceae cyanobacterium]
MVFLGKKESSLIPVFILASLVIQVILLLLLTSTFGNVSKLAKSQTPNLVELVDGTSARVVPLSHDDRSPQAISQYVGKTMVGLLSWNSVQQTLGSYDPSSKQELDRGVQAGERKVTTATWASSFGLSEDFRATFLTELAKLTPPDVFTGKTQSLLLVRYLSSPEKIGDSKWKQDLVANLVVFQQGDQVGKGIQFNKTIYVRSIDTPDLPHIATETQKAAYKVRKDGLEIFKIQDLVEK